jgi:hypothetical protein
MSVLFNTVNSGDVISSDLFNRMLLKLNDLEQRVSDLERGSVVGGQGIIDHFDPPAQQNVGQVLSVFGSFDFPPAANTVLVDGVAVTTFRPDSNNLHLSFVIPSTITIPVSGSKTTVVHVNNSKGKDDKSYLLLAPIASTVPPPTIASVVDFTNGTTLLRTNQKVRITGTNFAGNPTDNIIKLILQIGALQVTYPKTGQTAFVIDATQTNATQIVFTAPVIDELGVGSSAPATIQVGVGTAVPAALGVTIIRV